MIDRATIDKIMDATNIVDVVSEFVTLKKAGVNYKGLCPFHDDKTPSFMVSPSKQICKCFACGEGGTAINFLMKHEQITYPEALCWLAKKYNIEIQEKELTDEEKRQQSDRDSMFIINDWAMKYFHDTMKNDPDGIAIGKQYFRSRGIRDDIIEKFNLGFALNTRDALAKAAQKAGYQSEFLIKTGLCFERNEGKGDLVDRYAGRVIFPWQNVSGRVVAFGGRLLDARTKGVTKKYVNSPDSEIYHKDHELYGLFQAKKAIAKEEFVYMVEGYTDVIAMHQCGVENVVANSGTALSVFQIKLLRRFTDSITLLYDGDEAGIHAAMRGMDMLLAEGMKVKVVLLPDGDDPDSFSKKHSAQELKEYVEKNQVDIITFKTRVTMEGITDPVKRSEAINGIVESISVIENEILRSNYIKELTQRTGVKESSLINTMNAMIRKHHDDKERDGNRETAEPIDTTPVIMENADDSIERLLIQTVIRDGEKVIFENLETDDGRTVSLTVAQYVAFDLGEDEITFHNPLFNIILKEAAAHSGEEGFKAESYFLQHPDVEISHLASQLAIDRHQLGKSFQVKEREGGLKQHVLHLVLDLRMDIVEKHLKEIQRQLGQVGGDLEKTKELLEDFKETQKLRNALAKELGNDIIV